MMEAAKEDPVIVFSTDCHDPIIIRAKEPDVQPRAKLCYSRHASRNKKEEHKQRLELCKRVQIEYVCMHIHTLIFYNESKMAVDQVLTFENAKEKKVKL